MKNVILFGAGNDLKSVLKFLNKRHVKVIAIVDNDPSKIGMQVGNIKIFNPDILRKIKFNAVLITSSVFYKEISDELKKMEIKNILPVFKPQLGKNEKHIFKYSINLYGRCMLWWRNLCTKQEFYPSLIGIFMNPYFFARKGLLKYILQNKNYIKGKCMDFGCGEKPYEQLFSTTEYIGVEIECDNKKSGIVYYDGKRLPFKDNYFDAIICSQVLEHIPNIEEIMSEFHRVLKIGGYVLVTVPFTYPEHLKPFDFRRFSSYGIKNLMQAKGFKVITYQKSGNYIETITQMKSIYFNEKIFVNKKHLKILKKIIICIINLKGLIWARILKEDKDLYLDNIIVAKKYE